MSIVFVFVFVYLFWDTVLFLQIIIRSNVMVHKLLCIILRVSLNPSEESCKKWKTKIIYWQFSADFQPPKPIFFSFFAFFLWTFSLFFQIKMSHFDIYFLQAFDKCLPVSLTFFIESSAAVLLLSFQTHKFGDTAENYWQSMKNGER